MQTVIERLDPILSALAQIKEPETHAPESSESAQELIDSLCTLLEDGDAQAVDTVTALRGHPQLKRYCCESVSMTSMLRSSR